jgi:hypothetical protein
MGSDQLHFPFFVVSPTKKNIVGFVVFVVYLYKSRLPGTTKGK